MKSKWVVILALKPKIVSRKYIRQNSTMQNQDPDFKEVLIEEQNHQLEVDGVIYRELRALTRVVIKDGHQVLERAGKEEQILVHTRIMGDKTYKVIKRGPGLAEIEEVLEDNKMNSLELATFQEVWEKHKMTFNQSQPEAGGFIAKFKRFFKKLMKCE